MKIFICILALSVGAAQGQGCTDSDQNFVVFTDSKGGTTQFTSCAALIAQFKWFCNAQATIGNSNSRDTCCQSCSSVPANVCADIPVIIPYEGDTYLCPELVAENVGVCDTRWYANKKAICCKSCQDNPIPACWDNTWLTFQAVTAVNQPVTSYPNCAAFTAAHNWYCHKDAFIYHGQLKIYTRDECCQSCKGTPEEFCADQPLELVDPDSLEKYLCADVTEVLCDYDPLAKSTCCKSCSDNPLPPPPPPPPACSDSNKYAWKIPTNVNGGFVNIANCPDLISYSKYFCNKDATMQGGLKTRDVCCQSCKGISASICEDRPFVYNLGGRGKYLCPALVAYNQGYCNSNIQEAGNVPDECCKSCKNANLNCFDNNFIIWVVATNVNGGTKSYLTCGPFVEDNEFYCRGDAITTYQGADISTRQACCQSCKSISQNVCADIPQVLTVANIDYMCPSLVAKFAEFCDASFNGGQDFSKKCCLSCQSVNLNCYDVGSITLTAYANVDGTLEEFDSCQAWVTKHNHFCHRDAIFNYNNQNLESRKLCCESCQGYDPNGCYDEPLIITSMDGTERYFCPEFIAQNPHVCASSSGSQYKTRCCASCAAQVPESSCVDSGTIFTFSDLKLKNKNCADSVAAWPLLCRYGALPGNVPDGLKDQCCESCKAAKNIVENGCEDDPYFQIAFGQQKVNRYCSRLGSATSTLRIKSCCLRRNGTFKDGVDIYGNTLLVKEGCCRKCAEVVCP